MPLKRLIFILFLVLGTTGFAQNPSILSLDEFFEVPSGTIYWIHQSESGLIWVCTESGLFHFDGIQFHRLEIPGSKSRGISIVNEDKHGRLWIQNFSGQIFVFDGQKVETFKDWEAYSETDICKNFSIYDGRELA
ncbi:MAG: hypothetical protein AAFV80_18715, partial [Bacteroidota bacterium]